MNCKQAAQMLSEKLDRPLSAKEKMALTLHTTMCPPCRLFGKQMGSLRDLSKAYIRSNDQHDKKS
ncbi:zf-HC2 domain-containing protein [Marinomonas algarum]|uniref:Zf-HC2 domain-containing protein n=1 Tax=Marinomonas algarum TaxID=2883105 RepID=A0A9X1IN01_9GAMM|nr:zf-HC2 domain-containing protein [Marinomonas algarum]MCB5162125.1 zf-HC2 domain-containing protein [Marinomonas algarum]